MNWKSVAWVVGLGSVAAAFVNAGLNSWGKAPQNASMASLGVGLVLAAACLGVIYGFVLRPHWRATKDEQQKAKENQDRAEKALPLVRKMVRRLKKFLRSRADGMIDTADHAVMNLSATLRANQTYNEEIHEALRVLDHTIGQVAVLAQALPEPDSADWELGRIANWILLNVCQPSGAASFRVFVNVVGPQTTPYDQKNLATVIREYNDFIKDHNKLVEELREMGVGSPIQEIPKDELSVHAD